MKEQNLSFEFHDYKKLGIAEKKLNTWCDHFGWKNMLNRNGTTWKGLPEDVKNEMNSKAAAVKLMMEKPSVIKRPIVESNGKYLIRFDVTQYEETLLKS